MDIETDNQKELINNDINIPLPNGEINNKESNILIEENNNITSQPKLKLKKKVNKLKMPQESNNIKNEEIPVPNIDIEFNNVNILDNNDENNNIEIKIEENGEIEDNNEKEKEKEKENKGYLDDDLEDEDNKKLYLRVIKRMEKTYGVPVISAKIEGEPIEDIGLEKNIRPILLGDDNANKSKLNIKKNNYIDNNLNNNINNNRYQNKENYINNNSFNINNNKRTNNHINNNYNPGMKQYINNQIYNNNNLVNSQNINYNSYLNYRPKEYINNPSLYNKHILNNEFQKKYPYSKGKNFNNINSRIIPNKGNYINNTRKYSYDKVDKNLQKSLNYKYPIFKPNRIDFRIYNFNNKNLKYSSLGNQCHNYSNLRNFNQKRYNYPLKKTYFISYNNNPKVPFSNFSNSKPNNYKNYFNPNILNNNKISLIPKTNLKNIKDYKTINKNYNYSNRLYNNNPLFKKDIAKNKTKNIPLNKSQNIPRKKNTLYNYTGYLNKNVYERNNGNLLSMTQEIIGSSNKKSGNAAFHSYNNYHLHFNYANEDNINDYNPELQMPNKDIKFTYYINSRYN